MATDRNSSISDRRRVPAREQRWSKAAARYLAQRNVSPDAISIAGVLAALAGAVALALTSSVDGIPRQLLWILAGGMAGLRLTCNMLDGMVAVEWGKSSPVGGLYNEVPDRLADFLILVGAGYSYGGDVALGYVAASMALFTAYVRVAARSLGAPSDFGGPMAKPRRMAVVILTAAYLGLAPAAWHFSWGESNQYGLMTASLLLIAAGSAATAGVRLRRSAAYLRTAQPR